ncbi:hypothetical protein BO94DRAFT_482970 [Aspergillus sclerotioniger CBS 115572]|uniref:F-box domain-containing protein n=1 Tax=Aspergillus sclerotioniger CBS 115572 TaxID=1450535 RepID=A0A317XC93_9EURO|nr:hypothetical protein BO94DRAFT_482970 [Aspergillus sclerotioniger CBS 115572]PWY95955.1 hypothetical protein BO94DRAFT_482970 [Aspergillus sclerotioniger CBS 115572]
MPALSVSDLPADILLHLISFLDHSSDVRALSAISPALHALIHAHDLITKTHYRSLRISSIRDANHAFTTLLAILRNPKLGSYLRHIEMDIPIRSPLSYLPRKHDRSLSEADMQLLRRAINKAGFTATGEDRLLNMLMQEIIPARDWGYLTYYETSSEHGFSGKSTFIAQAITTLLVASSPHLVSLAISPPFWEYTSSPRDDSQEAISLIAAKIEKYPLAKFLNQANSANLTRSSPYLGQLKHFRLLTTAAKSPDARSRACAPQDLLLCIELVHALPGIQSLCIQAIQGFGNASGPALAGILPPASSNISCLDLRRCDFKSELLCRVIRAMKCLRELRYSVVQGGCYAGFVEMFDRRSLIQAVLGHRGTLEVLDLDFDDRLGQFVVSGVEGDAGGEGEGLRGFTVLRSLSLGVHCLWYVASGMGVEEEVRLVECLPSRLEFLRVRGYERGGSVMMDRMLAGMKRRLSVLRTVEGIEQCIPVGK